MLLDEAMGNTLKESLKIHGSQSLCFHVIECEQMAALRGICEKIKHVFLQITDEHAEGMDFPDAL